MLPQNNVEIEDKLLEKVIKKLPFGMQEELDAMGEEELKKRILLSEDIVRLNKVNGMADPDLVEAKEKVKELAAPYKETEVAQRAVISYCLVQLAGKGVDL